MADLGPLLGANPAATEYLEAYRALRASVLSSRPEGKSLSVLVTSAVPAEGKTTVSTNLATVLAMAEKNTLLVEADFRRPQVALLFGVPEAPGIAEVCTGRAEVGEALRSTDIPHLALLPAGGEAEDVADLMGSVRVNQLLVELKERFDCIIFDSAPTNSFAGAIQLGAMVDTVLLVVRSRTHAAPVQRALRALEAVGAPVAGIVLNDVMAVDREVTGGYYHRYDYRYRAEAEDTGTLR